MSGVAPVGVIGASAVAAVELYILKSCRPAKVELLKKKCVDPMAADGYAKDCYIGPFHTRICSLDVLKRKMMVYLK